MSEWDQREVCPDGACTGVIGADGTCKVCGRAAPNWGDERKRGLLEPDDDGGDDDYEDEDDENADEDHDPISPSAPAALGAASEWSERELCSDGACVGVLDDMGVCKVCGTKSPTWKPRLVRAPAPVEDAALRAAAADLAASMPAEAVDAIAPAPALEATRDDEDEPRELCSDGACVGVIGETGACKVCGKKSATWRPRVVRAPAPAKDDAQPSLGDAVAEGFSTRAVEVITTSLSSAIAWSAAASPSDDDDKGRSGGRADDDDGDDDHDDD